MKTEDYERLRAPLIEMLHLSREQYERNVAPVRAELVRLQELFYTPPSPIMIFNSNQLAPEVYEQLKAQPSSALFEFPPEQRFPNGLPSRITDLPEPPLGVHGLTQSELACESALEVTG